MEKIISFDVDVKPFTPGCFKKIDSPEPGKYEKEIKPEVIRAFCVELLEFIALEEKYKKFLDKEAIIQELITLTQKFIKDIRAAPNCQRCEIMYSDYSEPVYDLLSFGNHDSYNMHSKIKHKINDFRSKNKIALITDRLGVYP